MRLSSEDIGLWHRAMRDVIPLRGRPARPLPNPPLPVPGLDPGIGPGITEEGTIGNPPPLAGAGRVGVKAGEIPPIPTNGPVRGAPLRSPPAQTAPPPLDTFAGLDRASAERLKRGRYPVEARLDLHGMTQQEAHRALSGFVAGSRALGRRVVLVITGHGRSSGGILKSAVPRWLNEPDLRRHLLAMTRAQPRDGGTGALYLLLRKAS